MDQLFHLSVPNTSAAPDVAEGFVARVAASFGVDSERATRIALGAAAATRYIVEFGYSDDRADQIDVSVHRTETQLVLVINDHGEPELPGSADDPEQHDAEDRLSEAIEELHPDWKLCGYEGRRLTLSIDLPDQTPVEPSRFSPRATLCAPVDADQYSIRRLEPRDAAGVARLVFRTYGYTYDDEDYYYPDRIVAENQNGAMLSVVALHPSGEVVGHYALEQRDPPSLYEGSSAVVNPVHRGKQLMERMRALAVDEGRKLGLQGVFFLPWTIHTVSQRANEHFGAKLCAINLSDTSPVEIAGFEEDSLAQRASTMLYFTPLQELQPSKVFVPDRHRDMVRELYSSLGRPVSFGVGAPPVGQGVLETRELPHDRFGEIVVMQVGEDTIQAVEREVREFTIRRGAETVYLNLPLAQAGTPVVAEAAAAQGFGFLGIGPCFAQDGDTLRMALLNQSLDGSHIHVLSDLGQRLRDYSLADQARISDARKSP